MHISLSFFCGLCTLSCGSVNGKQKDTPATLWPVTLHFGLLKVQYMLRLRRRHRDALNPERICKVPRVIPIWSPRIKKRTVTSSTVREGSADKSCAAAPATCGDAIDVPWSVSVAPSAINSTILDGTKVVRGLQRLNQIHTNSKIDVSIQWQTCKDEIKFTIRPIPDAYIMLEKPLWRPYYQRFAQQSIEIVLLKSTREP